MKCVSAKLKFDLILIKTMLFYSVAFLKKVKSHDMKIIDDVSAGPSIKMTVKSAYNTFTYTVKKGLVGSTNLIVNMDLGDFFSQV